MMQNNHSSPKSPSPNKEASHAPDAQSQSPSTYRIVVLGGGEAGLTVVHALSRTDVASRMALIEPSRHHYVQRNWMLVGTKGAQKEHTRSDLRSQIPQSVEWIQKRVTSIDPEQRRVCLASGADLQYDYLVVALGTNVLWHRIRGLQENLGTHGICSVYGYEQAEQTWEMLRAFNGGRAIFTAPSSPYKGGAAPLKILHQAEALWRTTGTRPHTDLYFTIATPKEHIGPEYTDLLPTNRLAQAPREGLHVFAGYDLIEVRPERREAVFSVTKGNSRSRDVLPYDLIHVVPPMRPPALLEHSGLAYERGPMKGYLEVDPASLRHTRFPTVFGVGDAIGIDAVKTGERAREQADTVAHALRRLIRDE